VLAVRKCPEGGEAAIACDLGCNTLLDEWLKILLGVILVYEKIVMAVRVDKPGGNA
jgi:hypothetical protein